ncbi:MAG: hypothetical protein CO094_05630 [Anaerolineae bacterium CG_4_9_14_3_um_filter_57_17]|nr:hypothetical protein [bacterium]NCT20352.1 hypothetical protein [bacterium]OIO87325.1 MAG: hypothetical protein AUK01_00380 [Anaerolineae bacterium CG2_30_57_67]PJB67018.1 MAG: hypothetical protein CO094_05630 [Anaerolineae bacterium CG_4_9_14_3_um_filter_57_17]
MIFPLRNFLVFLVFLALTISACAPVVTIDDPQVAMETMVAATIAALPTNTPPPSATMTRRPAQALFTPTPLFTPVPVFSITPVPSSTTEPSPTPSETDLPVGGGEVGKYQGHGNFACMVMGQKPIDWKKVKADKLLYVVWTIKNVGAKEWRQGALEIIYVEGTKMYEFGPSQELAYTIPPGDTRDIVVVLRTPKAGGDYLAGFGLQHGSDVFCDFRIGVSVR